MHRSKILDLYETSVSEHGSLCYFSSFVADREVQRILLELLNQMDGFDQTVNVKVHCVQYQY